MHTFLLLAFFQTSSLQALSGGSEPMRAGCSPDDAIIATLGAQDRVEVQTARAGEGDQTCYKVLLTQTRQLGYVLGEALPSIAAFVNRREKNSAEDAEAQARLAREAEEAKNRPATVKPLLDPHLPSHFEDFSGIAPNGDRVNLSDLEGRAIVVTFWSPEDRGSQHRLASLLPLYNQLHKRGMAAVGVSMDRDASRIQEALDDVTLPWPQIADQGRLAAKYHIDPKAGQTFVLDASHNVIAAGVDVEKAVRQLIDAP
jgi:peroxiredoxin